MEKKAEKKIESQKKSAEPRPAAPVNKDNKYNISTEGALQEQIAGWELQKYDLLEQLNSVMWKSRNMARVWKLQKNSIFKNLDVLDNNIMVVLKQIKKMEEKTMSEEEQAAAEAPATSESASSEEPEKPSESEESAEEPESPN